MRKKSFFNNSQAVITLLDTPANIQAAIIAAHQAEMEGAGGIAFELSKIPLEERTVENFRKIVQSVPLPFMFIDYRNDAFHGEDDEARQKYLLMAADAGGEVIDVMGDLYGPAKHQLTKDPDAIAKQIKLIDQIHEKGAKVIMSSHTNEEMSAEEVLEHLQEQSSRGADILKLVVPIDNEKAFLEAMRTLLLLNSSIEKPFVFLGIGKFGRFIRYAGPKFGVAIEFALNSYLPDKTFFTPPTIRTMKTVQDNMHWTI